jgi:hypothetical protein
VRKITGITSPSAIAYHKLLRTVVSNHFKYSRRTEEFCSGLKAWASLIRPNLLEEACARKRCPGHALSSPTCDQVQSEMRQTADPDAAVPNGSASRKRRCAFDFDQHRRIGKRLHDAGGAGGVGRGSEGRRIHHVHRGDVRRARQQHVDLDQIAKARTRFVENALDVANDKAEFRQLIAGLRQGDIPYRRLRKALRTIHKPHTMLDHKFEGSDFRAQSISDAVVISTAVNPDGLSHLIYAIEQLALPLLLEGFLIRGAVVRGKLSHEDQTVFGEALIEAYRLESEVVRYPRVMVTSQVYNDAITGPKWSGGFKALIRQSDDGPYYLHILRPLKFAVERAAIPDPETDDASYSEISTYVRMGEKIQEQFLRAVDEPKHFEKIQWFARYWNSCLPANHEKLRPIAGPGLDIVTWRSGKHSQ